MMKERQKILPVESTETDCGEHKGPVPVENLIRSKHLTFVILTADESL